MEFGLLGGGQDGEYNGVSFVEMSEIIVMQDWFSFGTKPFDRVYFKLCILC